MEKGGGIQALYQALHEDLTALGWRITARSLRGYQYAASDHIIEVLERNPVSKKNRRRKKELLDKHEASMSELLIKHCFVKDGTFTNGYVNPIIGLRLYHGIISLNLYYGDP